MNQDDPLSRLVTSNAKEIDRQKLADLLEHYVVFDETSHELNFKDKFNELKSNADKLEVIFLADKARFLIFGEERKEGFSQGELVVMEVMPEGSVKSTLKTLSDKRKVVKSTEGKYYIPNYRISELFLKFKKD
jgi:hypothetical protein